MSLRRVSGDFGRLTDVPTLFCGSREIKLVLVLPFSYFTWTRTGGKYHLFLSLLHKLV